MSTKTPLTRQSVIAEKENLHPRNSHRAGYDFKQLCKSSPALKAFIKPNKYNNESVDFSDPQAVKALNQALLKHYYKIAHRDIPAGYLCPPIPGRADYIHYMADLLSEINNGAILTGARVSVLDIGTGANCVYPLIGSSIYGWQFTGTDIDPEAIRSAKNNVLLNESLKDKISIVLQTNRANIFTGIIKTGDRFDLTICNPPFHASLQEAQAATATKWKKLGTGKQKETLNFGGQKNELWCVGGESAFIHQMVTESIQVANQCLWFTTLVSKKETLPGIYKALKQVNAAMVKTITMKQGQKTSRIIAWTFLTGDKQTNWKDKYWQGI